MQRNWASIDQFRSGKTFIVDIGGVSVKALPVSILLAAA